VQKKSKGPLKLLLTVVVSTALALGSVVITAVPAEAAKKSPKMSAISSFPKVYKEDGKLLRPTKSKNHWYLDVWGDNQMTVKLNKKAKGKVCVYVNEDGFGWEKLICKTVKKGQVKFWLDLDPDHHEMYDPSESVICEALDLSYDDFDCAVSLDYMTTRYFNYKFRFIYTPSKASKKKFKKQTLTVGSTLFYNLTLFGDFRP
jgi:hypothetical protein